MGWKDLQLERVEDDKWGGGLDLGPLGIPLDLRSKYIPPNLIRKQLKEHPVDEGDAIFNCLMQFDKRWGQRYPNFDDPPIEAESDRLDGDHPYLPVAGENSTSYLIGDVIFELVLREKIVVGICVRNRSNLDEKVFIDRPVEMDTATLMDELHGLLDLNPRVEHGALVVHRAGVRHKMRSIGVLEKEQQKTSRGLVLPARYTETRRRTPLS